MRQGWRLVDGNGTHNVKILTEKYTKNDCAVYARMATTQEARTLTTASASGCRACCSRPTERAPSKCRRHLPLTTGFQIEENTLNDFRLVTFRNITTFCQSLMEQRSRFHRILVQYFVHKEKCLSWFYSTKTINSS